MIVGCTSSAGKSFLVTALCRHFANQGVRVAPFKAQNMSNNAAVTPDGLEIGRAQFVQALAARARPEARMQPVLLKPQAETRSQVIVLGRYDPRLTDTPWLTRKPHLWGVVRESLHSLLRDFELVVIEGAGSPAEVNLRSGDIVNMRVALEANADVYLVADIDRGGAFAHLLGTFLCLAPEEQALIRGFVLNKFRGDPMLLGDGMDWLRERTGVPTVAVVPMLAHGLPEEDDIAALAARADRARPSEERAIRVAILAYPYASNFDEFDPLVDEPGVSVSVIRHRQPLDDFDAVILPGSKHTAVSLSALRAGGLAAEVWRAAQRGALIHGVCGGMQMLGRALRDPHGLEGGGEIAGLGLLDVTTELAPAKVTQQREAHCVEVGSVTGYEIHHGVTVAGPRARPHLSDGLGWRQDNVIGIYLHDLFKHTAYRQWWLAQLGWQGRAQDWHARLDAELDRVAQAVMAHWPGLMLRPA
ncbi:MAG: cobyric acid synthase [Chloroflexi bacterium]|jgi:adenosylcobyric acid synthase|uniref:Cobyric acid synthase n=2 Tax=Candidatus Thermofonsia Clade 3 TaxID=2364209 RepID=A0A2M8QA83_9CHLR|nr:MAG: cobyric acid synthase [Candidatus Thermofonsia Clade 3 bacterium]RMG62862.1 MAG: cobyric acid synthase [Chloroflexota bacterium]